MHEDFVRAEGDEIVIKHFDGSEIFIPGALVYPAAPAKGLKVGDTVLADVAAASAPARVVKLEGSGDDQSIEIKYMWAGSSSDATLAPNGVVKLEDKVAFGQPVAWKKDGAWEIGDLAGGDATTGFVIESGGHAVLVPKKDLKPLKITRLYKKGDKVWASRYGTLKPGKVTEVVEGGLAYKVQLDSGEAAADPFEFGGVTSPLE
jgi:hypothetical protein